MRSRAKVEFSSTPQFWMIRLHIRSVRSINKLPSIARVVCPPR